ncbi:MAG: WecB/TagA/CpsF family glycosyltransferase [Phycisphaerae bacterium]
MATHETQVVVTVSLGHARSETEHRRPEPVDLLGMPVHPVGFEQAVRLLLDLARGDRPAYVVTANVDHLVRFSRCAQVRDLYTQADLVLADGMPLVWASRLLNVPLPERVSGSDLFPRLCAEAAEHCLSVFLLGGAPGTAKQAVNAMTRRHPKLRVVGTYCPDYGFEHDAVESARVIDVIREAEPDILFVGLGSPKQERWILANRDACGARLNIGVGISFSFVCGAVTRAPRWMRSSGLEWLHRLVQEPGRLWKRYLVQDLSFFPLVARELLRKPFTQRRARRSAAEPPLPLPSDGRHGRLFHSKGPRP